MNDDLQDDLAKRLDGALGEPPDPREGELARILARARADRPSPALIVAFAASVLFALSVILVCQPRERPVPRNADPYQAALGSPHDESLADYEALALYAQSQRARDR